MEPLSPGAKTNSRANDKVLSKSRLVKAFSFAFNGISYAWKHEPNFKIEVGIGLIVIIMALWLQVSPVPILLCAAIVLPLELLNSALEAAIDLISPERHPLAKLTKDAAAGAVLVASFISIMIGLWVLGPPLLAKLGL